MNLQEYLETSKSKDAETYLKILPEEKKKRKVIRGSEICRRRASFDLHYPESADEIELDDKSRMVMEMGNTIEEIIVETQGFPYHLETTGMGDHQKPIWSTKFQTPRNKEFVIAGTPDGWIKEELGGAWKLLEIKSTSDYNFEKEKLFPDRTADSYLEQIRTYLGIMSINEAPPPYAEMTWKDAGKDTEQAWIIPYPVFNKAKLIVVNRNSGETLVKDVDTGFRNKENAENWIKKKGYEVAKTKTMPFRRPAFTEHHPVCQSCKFFKVCYEGDPATTELDGETIEFFEELTKAIQEQKEISREAGNKSNAARNILVEEMTNRGINNFSLPSGKKGKIIQVKRRGSINTDKMKADGIYDTYWDIGDGTYQQLRITSPKE